jgi:hypothetical protein
MRICSFSYSRHGSRAAVLLTFAFLISLFIGAAEPTNLVVNGTFTPDPARLQRPLHWTISGNATVHQQLSIDSGPGGRASGKLVCTQFDGDGADYHAMLCQVGLVTVRGGHWYRLRFQARTAELKAGAVEVALVNTAHWENAGLADAFPASTQWTPVEFVFRALQDLAASNSRLQFWFKSTGTLWLADVVLEEATGGREWFPQIPTAGVKNFIPNSSFECGGANWGSFTWGQGNRAAGLYRLEGKVDDQMAQDGQHSLCIALTPETLPVYWADYFEPVRQPVRRVLVANRGWFVVEPGKPLTLSAWLRADAEGVAAQLAAVEEPSHVLNRAIKVGTQWTRQAFTFTPAQRYVFVAVGLDLAESKRPAARLWVDAVQMELGEQATDYVPRQPMEAFLETEQAGNTFTDPSQGARLLLWTYNSSETSQPVRRHVAVTDFLDEPILDREVQVDVPPHRAVRLNLDGVGKDRQGFFRARLSGEPEAPALRFAIIEPIPLHTPDSPFGFNHAYPCDFVVQLARRAGIVWWRDWSAKWQTVEPEQGRFEFGRADKQIRRVLNLDSQVEVLLPFPSATWSTTAKPGDVEKAADGNSYLRARLPLSYAPRHEEDFGRYALEVVRHYHDQPGPKVTTYQILNEPVYTDYALPSKFGYGLDDYIRLLRTAYEAMKRADPQARVVGGLSANLQSAFTRDFVARGGLQFLDVFDLHLYDPARPAESFLEPFAKLEKVMASHGGPKPVWITEWGCYADDDPAAVPEAVGDATMNRCRWASERAATEHIVKFTAVAFAHGVRKIFFHAGTCGAINAPDAGGVLFEYGGAPRKMLPGVAAFTRLVGVPDECVRIMEKEGVYAFVFRNGARAAAVAWHNGGPRTLGTVPDSVRVYDIMGNQVVTDRLKLGDSPVYVVAPSGADMDRVLGSL